VSAAAAHVTRMQWAVSLDLLILLLIPALVYVGWLAGAPVSRLATVGAGIALATALGAVGYLLAADALLYAAARQPDRGAAAGVVSGYLGNGVVTTVVVVYLAGHVVGFILLGVALARARTVPVWAAVAVGLWPLVEMAGTAAGITWLAAAGYGLLVVGFGGCAAALLRLDNGSEQPTVAPRLTAAAQSGTEPRGAAWRENRTTMNRSQLLVAGTRAAVAAATALAVAAAVVFTLALLAVAFVSLPVVGAAAARAAQANPVGWILLASGVCLPLAVGAYLYAQAAFAPGSRLPGATWAGWLDGWPWVPAIAVVPTVGLLLFPTGRPPSARWRPVLWAGYAVVGALTASVLLGQGLLDFPDRPNPTALPGAAGSFLQGLGGVIVLVAPLGTLGAWSVQLRRRQAADPRQARALALVAPAGWLIAASWWGCIVVTAATGHSIYALPAEAFAMVVLAATAWVAIHRYGLFDARLALRRALLYGGLSACVVVAYLLVGAGVERVTSAALAGPVAVAAAVLVALPLRDMLARAVNRLVYGYRDDPYGALARVGHRLEDAAAPADVLPAVARSVRDALRVPHVAIEIDQVVTEAGRSGGASREEFPLVFAGETIGVLAAEHHDGGLPFTGAERRLLAGIARQVAAAGHAVSLTRDLLRSRERLVAATEEERRRLRRDLHDGLGPGLAGIVLGLQRARHQLATDPDAAAAQLDALTAQTQQAIAEVRRLVYDLRPPALDELGLVGALTEQAQALGGITVEGPMLGQHLPAAVEVAAYRIALAILGGGDFDS
jgi:two-component system NarL family sensor kinase